MSRVPENPDRDMAGERIPEGEAERLRALLKRDEVAKISDSTIRKRIGETIARALCNRLKIGR